MKVLVALIAAGWLALMVQTSLGVLLPPPWCPDLAMLVVVGIGLGAVPAAWAALLATVLGYGADLVSGTMLGQHALLRLMLFSSARLASRQLELRGSIALFLFCFAATILYGGLLSGLTRFFADAAISVSVGNWLAHALVNALAAPLVVGLVTRVEAVVGGEEAARRGLRLDPRGGPA